MESIGIRELRQNASKYVKRAGAGERIEITDRGLTVATLGPASKDRWRELVESGAMLLPSRRIEDIEPGEYEIDASARLAEARYSER